jgi:threonine dehydratase
VAEEGGSIMEIDHDRAFASDDISTVLVHCVIETRNHAHIESIKARLKDESFGLEPPCASL